MHQRQEFYFWISKAIALAWILRLPVVSVLGLAIALDLRLSRAFSWSYLFSMLPFFIFLYGGGFAFNDYVDYASDIINLPRRPLPSGAFSPHFALELSKVTSALACLWAIILGYKAILYVFLFLFVSYAYSKWIKSHFMFLKNLTAALLNSSAFMFLAFQLFQSSASWYLFGTGMFFSLAREIIMDIRDLDGDQQMNIRTMVSAFGLTLGIVFALFFLIAGFVWVFLPVTGRVFSQIYLPWRLVGGASIGVLILGLMAVIYWRDRSKVAWFVAESIKVYWLLLVGFGFMGGR